MKSTKCLVKVPEGQTRPQPEKKASVGPKALVHIFHKSKLQALDLCY